MRLLLVLPIGAQMVDGRPFIDRQACNGLRLWLDNFEFVTLACHASAQASPSADVGPIDLVKGYGRVTFVPLPTAYTPHRFALALPQTARVLSAHIKRADYLQFAIGGLWGDWASLACLLAGKRPYAVWTDRVEHRVAEFASASRRGARRLYTLATARLMARYERLVIRRAALGLFHGADCFEAYSGYCRNPHLVHDIHVNADDLAALTGIRSNVAQEGPLRIVYAGRVHREKGVFDWIDAMAALASKGTAFEATWIGDGPDLEAARQRGGEIGLTQVSFPGPTSHDQVLRELSKSDVFTFCHKTPESPRCLIEALQCGLPIVGYESAYPRDLINENGGGLLTRHNDPVALAGALASLGSDRTRLASLHQRAAQDGMQFTAELVFRHRSELIKSFLKPVGT